MTELGQWVSILLNGLVIASTLFLVSSGLSIVFGVSRISNFAHGSLYMLGAYIAYSAVQWMPRTTLGFFAAVAVTAIAVGVIGFVIEVSIFRRLYHVPHHLQLIATFGIFLIVRDVTLLTWGPQELFSPRVPGLGGAVEVFGRRFPEYYLVIMAVSIIVLGVLWFLFHHTRWGVLLRAATQDRDMVAALGVDQKWLFTGVFVLSAALAGLAGALDAPRLPASLGMDITIIIEAFAVVVIGGMGSILGCFLAALLVGVLTAVATVFLPQATLALVFVVMALVLVVRPRGFFGKNTGASWEDPAAADEVLRPAGRNERVAWTVILALLLVVPFVLPAYWLDTLIEVLIWTFVAWSFYSIAGTGGMMSFGQAAFFGIGVYAPALLHKYFAWTMVPGMLAAPIVAGLAAIIVGWFAVRLSGIYFAMLTLAFAQIIWSITFQWFQFTNGELGILNLWPVEWARDRRVYYFLTLAVCVGGIMLLRRVVFSPFGASLRAGRDSELRAEATGIDVRRQKWIGFAIAGVFGGMAGALMVYLKGSAFPSYLDISTSFDVFVMALLGGLQSLNGPILGAAIYQSLKTVLQTYVAHWNIIVGAILILLAIFMPRGVSGIVADIRNARARARAGAGAAALKGAQ
jgi:branched-chain amino acid transport system permease protein